VSVRAEHGHKGSEKCARTGGARGTEKRQEQIQRLRVSCLHRESNGPQCGRSVPPERGGGKVKIGRQVEDKKGVKATDREEAREDYPRG